MLVCLDRIVRFSFSTSSSILFISGCSKAFAVPAADNLIGAFALRFKEIPDCTSTGRASKLRYKDGKSTVDTWADMACTRCRWNVP
jgi:hypothetical protein